MTAGHTPAIVPGTTALDRRAAAAGGALLAAAVSALFFYKWGGSLRALRQVTGTGTLSIRTDALLEGGVWASMAHYFERIGPALVYGILIGAIVRSTVSPAWIVSLLGRRTRAPVLAGAALGSPLMLCSCCVTPVFTGVVERGARLGPALALMLASPGLNVAALTLTFLLFPVRLALLRVAGALVIVLLLGPIIGGRLRSEGMPRRVTPPEEPTSLRGLLPRLARNIGYMIVVTVPLIVVGVFLSAILLPTAARFGASGAVIGVVVIALAATLVALPTFFEIPLALSLLQLGAPTGAVVALLVAGPIVNLPSLLVLSREAGVRVAVALAAGVWLVACLAGAVA